VSLSADAFAEHWRLHHHAMVRGIRAKVGFDDAEAEAEDIVAETYARAWRARDRFVPDPRLADPLAAWLIRIAHNLVKDRAKRGGRRRYQYLSLDACQPFGGEEDIDSALVDSAAADALNAVEDAIDAEGLVPLVLAAAGTDEQRVVLAAHYLDGREYQHILPGTVPVAVRALSQRGRAAIRRTYPTREHALAALAEYRRPASPKESMWI
jgi:DNA-directed RNA polymerase specialized sigma24 family protein